MGNGTSNNVAPDSSSDDELESEFTGPTHKMPIQPNDGVALRNDAISKNVQHNVNLDTDAINPQIIVKRRPDLSVITLPIVQEIENELDNSEKISLIFILSENVDACLNKITLYNWVKNEIILGHPWQGKLIEAMAIIKNFQIPKKYGFMKAELLTEFVPLQYFTAKYVNRFRKIIYCICERMTEANENDFLRRIAADFRKKNLQFIEFPQMEMYFSYFIKIGYVTEANVQNCSQIFKLMEFEDICDMLRFQKERQPLKVNVSMVPPEGRSKADGNVSADDAKMSDEFYRQLMSSMEISLGDSNISGSSQDNAQEYTNPVTKNTSDIYNTSGNKFCLIIDQENFHTEINPAYKHLLPENCAKEKLHTRTGTHYDSHRLEGSLTRKHFQVKTERNLNHLKMIDKLKTTVKELDDKNCSCFLVAIFSHGDEGVIYGCNSCYVEVSQIVDIMCDKKLDSIPKVLILQSCQGPALQTSNIEMDGPSAKAIPYIKTQDFLIFWSTVPGFSSIRNKQTGTWFIQSLCNQLDQAKEEHFEEICTNIIREVTNQKWAKDKNTECFMVPLKQTTFTKKLYLTH